MSDYDYPGPTLTAKMHAEHNGTAYITYKTRDTEIPALKERINKLEEQIENLYYILEGKADRDEL